jgi:hypothetical protein
VLLEESKTATPLVESAHLSAVCCPHIAKTAMIFIFLPRISLFYIMTHVAGSPPKPHMRIAWPNINLVLGVEIAPSLNSLVAIAGLIGAECRLTMKAWTILGTDGCTPEDLKLVARPVSQRVGRLMLTTGAAVVFKEPTWSRLWSGGLEPTRSGGQQGVICFRALRLASVMQPSPFLTSACVPETLVSRSSCAAPAQ